MNTPSFRQHPMLSLRLSLGLSLGLSLCCALTCLPAGAGVIYKCKVNGKISYDDKPCDTGEQTNMAVASPIEPPPKKKIVRRVVEYEEVDDDGAGAPPAARPTVGAVAKDDQATPAVKRAPSNVMQAPEADPHAAECADRKTAQRQKEQRANAISGNNGYDARADARRSATQLALSCPA